MVKTTSSYHFVYLSEQLLPLPYSKHGKTSFRKLKNHTDRTRKKNNQIETSGMRKCELILRWNKFVNLTSVDLFVMTCHFDLVVQIPE